MKAVVSQLQFHAQKIDERLIQCAFLTLTLFFALILHSPTDGTGGIR